MGIININKRKEWVSRWQIKNPKHKVYNDGVLNFGVYEKIRKAGKEIDRKFKPIDSYPFRIMTVREQDKEIAFALNKKIEIKVAIPYNEEITSKNVVSLRNKIYSIVIIDKDRAKREVYLNLAINEGEDR